LSLQEVTANSQPSWFGFLLTVKAEAGFTRNEIVTFLEANRIQTRMLFAGNLIKHPCFDEMRSTGAGYRVVGELSNTDLIMERTFWVGVYPGITEKQVAFISSKIKEFVQSAIGILD
jgi:CDP-6-deoxy-D-xylo-4-hexulose-3-dehydrase